MTNKDAQRPPRILAVKVSLYGFGMGSWIHLIRFNIIYLIQARARSHRKKNGQKQDPAAKARSRRGKSKIPRLQEFKETFMAVKRGEPLRHPTFQAWCVRLCVASKGVLLSFPMFCFVRASASKRKLRVQLTTYEQSSDNPVSLFSKF